MKLKHVMIDTETLATTADAVIMSIGAVKFDLDSDTVDDAGFYASVSIDSNLQYSRSISEDTLVWWLQQSATAQKLFTEPKQTLDAALQSLDEFFDHPDYCVWSNGADFDIPLLAHAYKQLGWETPWKFWNSRCVRTYRGLPFAAKVPKLANDHHALRDAINQAKLVQQIQRAMKETV